MTLDRLAGLALALAIGLLIGAERGWRMRDEEPGGRVAGIRTFALVGLLGGSTGLQASSATFSLFALLCAGAVLALVVGYAADIRRDNNVSATSAIAAVLTLGWGAAAGSGQMALASVGAGATMLLLGSRNILHGTIGRTSEDDVKALLRLVLVVLVVLPLLPDANFGPMGALNPRRLWMVVVITGAISFLGYALARALGNRRSILAVAGAGALVSSTAVTADCGRRLRAGETDRALHAAVPLASAVMLARSLVLVGLLAPTALGAVSGAIAPALVVSILCAGFLLRTRAKDNAGRDAEHPSPPGLGLAFLFALSVAGLAMATAWVGHRYGDRNAALVIATGGTVDIDAAIAAVGALPPGTLTPRIAALALAAPTLFNTLFKLAVLVTVGGWRNARAGATALAIISLVLMSSIAILLL
ncbi:MgtC/SapB family protein [Tsuneonella sp. HG249]